MKTLYLLRHAHAQSAEPRMDDHDRALSPRGETEARNAGAFMKEQGLVPDAMLCSSSARTKDTARIVFEVMFDGGRVPVAATVDRALYLATPRGILEEIAGADDRHDRLLVIGHNPGMEDLAEALAGASGQVIGKFPPSALAVFISDAEKWEDFSVETAKLKTVFMP